MRAYLIDPYSRSVDAVDVATQSDGDASLDAIRALVCGDGFAYPFVESFRPNHLRDVVFIPDIFGHTPPDRGFGLHGYPHPILGRGVMFGTTPDGYCREPCESLASVRERTFFFDAKEPQ